MTKYVIKTKDRHLHHVEADWFVLSAGWLVFEIRVPVTDVKEAVWAAPKDSVICVAKHPDND